MSFGLIMGHFRQGDPNEICRIERVVYRVLSKVAIIQLHSSLNIVSFTAIQVCDKYQGVLGIVVVLSIRPCVTVVHDFAIGTRQC